MTQLVRNFNTPTTTHTTNTTTEGSSINSSSSSTSIHTQPGVHDLCCIKEAYNNCIGDLKAPIAWYLEGLMASGMQPEVILNAIQETGWARRPSPQYLRAILERYKAYGILNMMQLIHDQDEHAESKKWYE